MGQSAWMSLNINSHAKLVAIFNRARYGYRAVSNQTRHKILIVVKLSIIYFSETSNIKFCRLRASDRETWYIVKLMYMYATYIHSDPLPYTLELLS